MSESGYSPGSLINKYAIRSLLGRGAMGVVYRATDTTLDRDVALKVMAPDVAAAGADALARFQREAKALARVQHPNVVTVHEVGTNADGSPYIVMELLAGQDLQATMRSAALPVGQKVDVLRQVLEGLSYAHAADVVHRDIKPANIFVCTDGRVKITDFGLARLAEQTMTLAQMGSPAYMSPEQANGTEVDSRSDLFSVGSVAYELLLGRRPFVADTIAGLLYKIVHDAPDFSGFSASGEYGCFRSMIETALEKDPARRYPSARHFAEGLRAAVTPPSRRRDESTTRTGDVTIIEVTDAAGASYPMREPAVVYPSSSGPNRETRGIRVRRGSAASFLEWARIRSLHFNSRRAKNSEGAEIWQHDITAELAGGASVVVGLVEDWNMAYPGGGGTGLLFGKTDLGESSVKFSEIREVRVVQSADV